MNAKPRFGSSPVSHSFTTTALLAALGLPFLAGCGGGGGGKTSTPTSTPTPTSSSTPTSALAGRSFVTSNVSLGNGQTGTLVVAVGSDGASIAGTLNLAIAAVSGKAAKSGSHATRQSTPAAIIAVPLSGLLDKASGNFQLNTILSRNGTSYSVAASGTLGTSSTSLGTSQIGVQTYVGGSVTGTSNGIGIFTNGASVSGALTADYFPITPNQDLVYTREFTEFADGNPEGGEEDTAYGDSFLSGADGFGEVVGTTTQVMLNGITVNKTPLDLNGDSQLYYTLTSSQLSVYQYTDLEPSGSSTSTTEDHFQYTYSPPQTILFNLSAGQTSTNTFTITETDLTTAATKATSSATVVTTFNDMETITVPTGTYTAAKFSEVDTVTYHTGDLAGETDVTTRTYFLVKGIGVIQEHAVTVATTPGYATVTTVDDHVLTGTNGF